MFKDDVLPASVLISLPNLDFVIVPTSGKDTFIFRVCPLNLPDWTVVGAECI